MTLVQQQARDSLLGVGMGITQVPRKKARGKYAGKWLPRAHYEFKSLMSNQFQNSFVET